MEGGRHGVVPSSVWINAVLERQRPSPIVLASALERPDVDDTRVESHGSTLRLPRHCGAANSCAQ